MTLLETFANEAILEHWGFTELPFFKVVNGTNVYENEVHQQRMHRLQQVLLTREIGVVVGEAGTGKTTLLKAFREVASRSFRVIQIDLPPVKPQALYRSISQTMGVDVSLRGADALKVANLLSYSCIESNRPNVLLLDESHLLPKGTLDELRVLTNTTIKNMPVISLVLFGQPLLATNIQSPELIPLAQRVHSWVTMRCLNENEGVEYLNWHLATAGGSPELFSEGAKRSLIRWVKGNHRMINRLAWECLNQGFLDEAHTVTEELLSHVCKNLGPHLKN